MNIGLQIMGDEMIIISIIASIASFVFCGDRIVVWLIFAFHIRVCREAINLAMSIYSQPDTWRCTGSYRIERAQVGNIAAQTVGGILVRMAIGDWKPNRIERRIIYSALRWRLQHEKNRRNDGLKRYLMAALSQPALMH